MKYRRSEAYKRADAARFAVRNGTVESYIRQNSPWDLPGLMFDALGFLMGALAILVIFGLMYSSVLWLIG